jgi:hypothetical protein
VSEKSLKSQNIKWLIALALLDAVVVLLFIAPEVVMQATPTELAIARAAGATFVPVLVLILTSVLPHELKASIVYWRVKDVLPGSRAFDRYGPKDPRVDMRRLEKNIGKLPSDAREQNQKWFALYRLVRNEIGIAGAHKLYLLFRDMAAMSIMFLLAVPACLFVIGGPGRLVSVAAAFFTVQYVLTALSARWSGIRMVCSVLAEHSATKVAGSKPRG